uniref:Uncharacterized protein n=1 Tax=Acrobeloides nanus TaxID=290746 RepID=A0A914EGN8_9BILA
MYLVYFVSKELSYVVKLTLINTAVMVFLVVFVYLIWMPVPLFPYLGGFSISLLKYLGKEVGTLRMAVTVPPDFKTGLDPRTDHEGGSYAMFLQLATRNEKSAITFSINNNGWAYAWVIWMLFVIVSGLIGIFILNYRLSSTISLFISHFFSSLL